MSQPSADAATLTQHRLRAIEELASGDTVASAAEHAGVTRETVHRWMREDANFQAALNGALAAMREATERELLAVAEAAAETLLTAVQEGNVPAAIAILKGLGFLAGERPIIGSTDPAAIVGDAETRAVERQQARTRRLMLASSG